MNTVFIASIVWSLYLCLLSVCDYLHLLDVVVKDAMIYGSIYLWNFVYNYDALLDLDCMVVGLRITNTICAYYHLSCEFKLPSVTKCHTLICVKVCQWLVIGGWISPVSSTIKYDHHDITKIVVEHCVKTTIRLKQCMIYLQRWQILW